MAHRDAGRGASAASGPIQNQVKHDLREVWTAPDGAMAEKAVDIFAEKYSPKYDKAIQCLIKDRDRLLTFVNFPAEPWDHIQTIPPLKVSSLPSVTARSEPRAPSRQQRPS